MYGPSFCIVTVWPRAWSSLARDAETIPLPKDEVTPPVTNMYLVFSFMPVSLRETKIDQRSFGEGINYKNISEGRFYCPFNKTLLGMALPLLFARISLMNAVQNTAMK